MDATEINELADRIFAGIEAGDIAAIAEMWHDDIEVWHNTDGTSQNKEENLAVMRWMARKTSSVRYTDVRRHLITDGLIQQHTLQLEFPDGRTAALHAALFITFVNGRVRRLDEYIDSASANAAFSPR